MLNKICNNIIQNKNILMLISSAIYMLALFATLSENLLIFSIILSSLFIFLVVKEYFPIKYIIIWTLLFLVGVLNVSTRLKNVDELLNFAPINSEIIGTVVSIPQGISENKPKFFFRVSKIKFDSIEKDFLNEKVLVTINSQKDLKDLKIYNSFILKGRLSVPFKAGNPSQFDYANYLRNHSAYAVFYAKDFELLKTNLSLKERFLQSVNDYREKVIKTHSKYLKSPNLELLGGIVFGDDAVSPSKEIKKSFANSGLLHILAASGMNVAFIFGFFFCIFSRLRFNYKLNVILGMLMVVVYSLMTGLGASIIRATIMLLFVLVGKLIDRDAHSISLLSFVALLMLLYNPLFINDVGFQLSFIVTFGILLMAPAVIKLNNRLLDSIIGAITIPIIAQLWVIPVQIFYFSNISIYSVFANIMSVPILAIISFGGFISALLSVLTPISDFVCRMFDYVLNPLLSFLVNISDFWGYLPNSTIQTAHPIFLQIAVYYLILLCITGFLYKDFRDKYFKKLLTCFFSLLLVWLLTFISVKNNNLHITTFDVGNADCFLIKTPKNEYIMIDTGKFGYNGGQSQAEIIVLKYLKDRGIKNLKFLILSHFDNDHCGGAVDILNTLNVDKLYVNSLTHESNAAKAIYKSVNNSNTALLLAKNNEVIYNDGNLKLINLLSENSDNDNESSIINLLEYNNFRMLFTGDASTNGLEKVLKYVSMPITVLKVPHHGAYNGLNSNIIKLLSPQISILSVGENKFGHPAQYILELLRVTKILRTDIDNSILIKVNERDYKIFTYDIRKRKYIDLNKI